MSKNSQKLNLMVFTDWLKGINPKSESLHQPKVITEQTKQPFKRRY